MPLYYTPPPKFFVNILRQRARQCACRAPGIQIIVWLPRHPLPSATAYKSLSAES